MRLNEITNTKVYTSTAAEAEKFLKRLSRLWPARSPDDLTPSVPRDRKQPPIGRRKLFDAL
jgi:hypothetical protein